MHEDGEIIDLWEVPLEDIDSVAVLKNVEDVSVPCIMQWRLVAMWFLSKEFFGRHAGATHWVERWYRHHIKGWNCPPFCGTVAVLYLHISAMHVSDPNLTVLVRQSKNASDASGWHRAIMSARQQVITTSTIPLEKFAKEFPYAVEYVDVLFVVAPVYCVLTRFCQQTPVTQVRMVVKSCWRSRGRCLFRRDVEIRSG